MSELNITKRINDFKPELLDKSPSCRPALNVSSSVTILQDSHPPNGNGCAIVRGGVPLNATHLLSVMRSSTAIDGNGRMAAKMDKPVNDGLQEATSQDKAYHSLADTWGTFLEPYDWDWFCTLTFKDCTHPESAGKVYDNWIHALNRDAYGQGYWKDKTKGVFYARGTEWQRRGVIHYHALIGGIPDFVRISKYVNWWKAHVAPQVTIDKYDRKKGGRFYMAKSAYTFKRGEIDCNDALVLESRQSRTCAKSLHNDFLQAYVGEGLLHGNGLSSYSW
jgi:hypothetical protein